MVSFLNKKGHPKDTLDALELQPPPAGRQMARKLCYLINIIFFDWT
jgi:hypothetical protein